MSNLEYITQARKLLTEDYKTKHANEYNDWLARQQHSWQQPHIVVPYPPFIVSAALAPFKASVSEPSEGAVVSKALELYNQFNPVPVAKTEPESVVEQIPVETVAEPIAEEPVIEQAPIEPVVEQTPVEPVVETSNNTDAIYKIFQEPVVEEIVSVPATEPLPPTIESALNVVPQPAEELARVKSSGRILPSVLQRLQEMKDKWSSNGEQNV